MRFDVGDPVILLVDKDYGDRVIEAGSRGSVIRVDLPIMSYLVAFVGDPIEREVPDDELGAPGPGSGARKRPLRRPPGRGNRRH